MAVDNGLLKTAFTAFCCGLVYCDACKISSQSQITYINKLNNKFLSLNNSTLFSLGDIQDNISSKSKGFDNTFEIVT